MAMFIRPKQVSDPLDDRAKARLTTGYASSGSEHSADVSCINSSLVHAFFHLDQESADEGANAWPDSANDDDSNGSSRIVEAIEAVRGLLLSTSEESQRLCRDVSEAAEEASAGLSSNRSLYRRRVMARLREAGYNAGICKAKWEGSGGLTAGSYEYIDIPLTTNDDDDRYIYHRLGLRVAIRDREIDDGVRGTRRVASGYDNSESRDGEATSEESGGSCEGVAEERRPERAAVEEAAVHDGEVVRALSADRQPAAELGGR